jgi:hypothetical protein
VGVTPGGVAWIGYDDDTVAHRRLGDENPSPPWDSGLVALNSHGEVLFDFDRLGTGPNHQLPFSDCYALNVVDDHEVWVYYWQQFSLVRLVDYQITWRWDTIPVRFAEAFAVANDYEPRNTVLLAALAPSLSVLNRVYFDSLHTEQLTPVRASGERIQYVEAFGRADHLYLRHAAGYSVFTVEEDG